MTGKSFLKGVGVGFLKLIFNAAFYLALIIIGWRVTREEMHFVLIFGFVQFLCYDLLKRTFLLKKAIHLIGAIPSVLGLIAIIYSFIYVTPVDFGTVVKYDFAIAWKLAFRDYPIIFMLYSGLFYEIAAKKEWGNLKLTIATVIFPVFCYGLTLLGYMISVNHVLVGLLILFVVIMLYRIFSKANRDEYFYYQNIGDELTPYALWKFLEALYNYDYNSNSINPACSNLKGFDIKEYSKSKILDVELYFEEDTSSLIIKDEISYVKGSIKYQFSNFCGYSVRVEGYIEK